MPKAKKQVVSGNATDVTTSCDDKTDSTNMVIKSRIVGMVDGIKKIHMKLNKRNVDKFNASIRRCCTSDPGVELVCRSSTYNSTVQPILVQTTSTIFYIKSIFPPAVVDKTDIFFSCVDDTGACTKRVTISITRDRDNAQNMFLTLEPEEGPGYIPGGSFVIDGDTFAESVFAFIWGIAQIPGFEVFSNLEDIDARLVLFKECEENMFPKMMSLCNIAGTFVDNIGVPLSGGNASRINDFLNTADDVVLNIIKHHDAVGYANICLPSIRIVCVDGVFKLVGIDHIAMDRMLIDGTDITAYIENGRLLFTNCASIKAVSVIAAGHTEKCTTDMLHPLIGLLLKMGVDDVIVEHQYANIFNVK